ncbi:hypothetical protein H6F51_02955 [Cyanobacteria bacterium FACHB-DQ100]|uniref:hypothetical protein n=1 Tax=unclassified Leptolyngbya TaxID=2650499 RepID=UPI001681C2B2|nr:hypothetical protein [Leptolyngbya sp. FACHB-17]MBD1821474.1 hypothetical protein [Cyanobacteria bacterium FACHB-DQ100]MBD2082077.1 hypothetical protein [Leptolyngbya sp. FACHB-17]
MPIPEVQASVKYVTNAAGEKTDVLIPVELWKELIKLLQLEESGLDAIDENDASGQILADLQEAILQGRAGETFPISKLWDGIDI